MSAAPDREPLTEFSLQDEVVQGVLFGVGSDDNEKWASLDAEDAALIRGALVKAAELRKSHTDPGDAYMRGIADIRAIDRVLPAARLILEAVPDYVPIEERDAS